MNSRISSHIFSRALYEAASRATLDRAGEKLGEHFWTIAETYHLSRLTPKIVARLAREHDAQKNRKSLHLETARAVSSDTTRAIRSFVEASHDVSLEARVNEKIIGGFVARFGGMTYDASIATQLKKLYQLLSP